MRIQLRNVNFKYEKENVLHNIQVDIPTNSFTLICGQTGSGKSTMLQLLSGLELPTTGEILFSEEEPRGKVAIVFQLPDTQIFANSVREEIEYGLELRKIAKDKRLHIAKQSLEQVGLNPELFLDRSPFLLSGGEKRRVTIASALALNPRVLILDEPTAGLDPAAIKDLLAILLSLHTQGLTIIISTHDLDLLLPFATQIIIMHKGLIHFDNSIDQLVQQPQLIEEAGLEVPTVVRITQTLRKQGLDIQNTLHIENLVAAIQKQQFTIASEKKEPRTEVVQEKHLIPTFKWDEVGQQDSIIHRLDPRAKWFSLFVLCLSVLTIQSWTAMFVTFAVALILLTVSKLSIVKTYKFVKPFFVMFFFLWIFSSISMDQYNFSLGPIGFSIEKSLKGGLGVCQFLVIIVFGYIFTETTIGTPLREGFEWGISFLRKFKFPTRDLSMTVSITLQFVPWILEKLGQLGKALNSRGRDTIGIRKYSPKQISLLIVPLVIIVLKMGDELVSAIESRGYTNKTERTSWYQLKWTTKDTIASGLITVLSLMLFLKG